MTAKAQTYIKVFVTGHIDGPFKEWEAGILKRVAREMELQFGENAHVSLLGGVLDGSHLSVVDPTKVLMTSSGPGTCPRCGSVFRRTRRLLKASDSEDVAEFCKDPWHEVSS